MGTEKIWDPSLPNMAISWVCEQHRASLPAYFEAVYPAFWRRELDIEDINVVIGCIEAAGVDATGFVEYAAGPGRDRHDALQAQLHPAGIYGVPTYVFDGQILFGREHLPYIGWYLGGQQGAAPDIGYAL